MNVMNTQTFRQLKPKRQLSKARIKLDSPGGSLKCMGQIDTTVVHKDKEHTMNIKAGQTSQ